MALEFMLREDAQETFLKFFEDNAPSNGPRTVIGASPEPFQYQPLKTGEIRLLKLLHTDGEGPTKCELVHTKIRKRKDSKNHPDNIPYKALSYTWGKADPRMPILINGHSVLVGFGLYVILLSLRRHPEGHTMWIDAICINQMDYEERSQQVQLMTTIYARAEMIFCWLGPGSKYSHTAIDHIGYLYNRVLEKAGKNGTRGSAAMATMTTEEILGDPHDPKTGDVVKALEWFTSQDWWYRTWVLQEASSLPEKILICGNDTLSWGAINNFGLSMIELDSRTDFANIYTFSQGGITRLISFWVRRHVEGPFRRRLLTLLQNTRKSMATDNRDKVYAILPFASDLDKNEIVPDYKKSIAEVYTDVVLWHLKKHNNLDFLGSCAHTAENVYNLPSWVPDWNDRSEQGSLPKWLPSTPDDSTFQSPPKRCYDADGSAKRASSSFTPPQLRTSPKPCYSISGSSPSTLTLTLTGLRLSLIRCVTPTAHEHQDHPVEQTDWPIHTHPATPIEKFPVRDPLTSERRDKVYLRCLVADTSSNMTAVPVSRPGKMKFPDPNGRCEGNTRWSAMAAMREVTRERRLFYTGNVGRDERKPQGIMGAITAGPENGTAIFGDGGALMGIGSHECRAGDEVWMLRGGSVLYVLRPVGCIGMEKRRYAERVVGEEGGGKDEEGRYRFVGECYVHGLMDGEVLDMLERKRRGVKKKVLEDIDAEFREVTLV